MKKKISILLFSLLSILLFPNIAKADLSCDVTYQIYKDDCATLNLNGATYGMNTYSVSNYPSVKAYCIDPVRKSGTGSAGCVRRIDPSSSVNGLTYQAYDVAVTKAYQMLTERGRNTTSRDDRVLGEVVFRWIGYKYGVMNTSSAFNDTNICESDNRVSASTILSIFNPIYFNHYWANSSYVDRTIAQEIYNTSIGVGDRILSGATYDSLVSGGSIWGDRYVVDSVTQTTTGSNVDQITVTLTLQNDVQNVYWDEFTGGCDNTGVVCTSTIVSHSGNTITIQINVEKRSGYNGQDYEVYVQSSVYDTRSSSSNMIIASPTSWQQQMLLVSDSSSGQAFIHGGTKVYVDSTPGTPEGGNHVCEIIDGQHYCNDGQPCSEPEYRKDCLDEPVNCTPTVTMPGDCNNFDVEDETTGIISDINEVASSCNPNVNQVTQCVLGHDDLTSQSYESTLDLSENPYCKVYCKESYQFNMPTAKITRSGGYFTLQTTINAIRDCYVASSDNPTTGQGIDTAKFNADLTAAYRAVVDAYNQYAYYRDAAAVTATHESKSCPDYYTCSATADIYTKNWKGVLYDYNGRALEYDGTPEDEDDWDVVTIGEYTYTGRYSSGSITCEPAEDIHHSDHCSASDGDDPDDDGEGDDVYHAGTRDAALTTLENAADKLNTIIQQYNSCTGAIDNSALDSISSSLTDILASSNDATSWTNDMRFDPVVTFNYNQDYMNQMSGTFEQTSISGPSTTTTMYCTGGIDGQYNCNNGGTSNLSSVVGTREITACGKTSCSSIVINLSSANYVQKSKSASATYAPNNEFSTYTQYGTIKLKHESCSGNDCLWSNLPEDALPVSLITQTGVFPFVINYSNIGQSNSDGSLGRLAGNSTSVLTEYNDLDPSVRCTSDTTGSDYLKQDAGYVCHYLTNCDGEDHCQFTCDDDNNCEFTDVECTDDHCILTCENCIFDGESNNFSYRTITLNNLNPNSRSLGFNWSNVKGQATQRAIEEAGETIYESPQYSYTLTPSNLSNIREYNNEAGSYTNAYVPDEYSTRLDGNASLYCQTMDYNGVSDGLTYNCRSRFLDLIESSGNEFATESYRITSDYEEGTNAFESFNSCSGGYGNGECEYIGPSWRIREAS